MCANITAIQDFSFWRLNFYSLIFILDFNTLIFENVMGIEINNYSYVK